MRARLVVATACALLLATGVAHADHAEAVRLFDEGRKQRDGGEYEKALRTFERSLAEEKSVGSYFNLGLVLEQLGRYREAYDAFQVGRDFAVSKGDEREKDLRDAQSKLLDTRNHIQLAVPPDVKNAEGVRIIVDNIEVPAKQYDGYVFRNQTQHEVVVFARGRKELRIQAKNRGLVAVSLGEIDRGGGVVVPPIGDKDKDKDKTTEPSGPGWPTQKWVGVAMMTGGVAVGAVGLVFNIKYLADRSDFQAQFVKECSQEPQCKKDEPNTGANNVKEAAEANDTRTSIILPVTYVSAAALFGFGLYFFLTADDAKKVDTNAARITVSPHVGPRDASFSVIGRF